MSSPATTSSKRLTGEAGALIPEFALVAPFMIMLVLGIFEFGMAWREKSNLASAIRSAARQDSNAGIARSADYLALQSFWSTMATAKSITVNRVVIFKSANADGTPTSASCLSTAAVAGGTGVNGECNIYSLTQLQTLGANYWTNFGPQSSPPTADSCAGAAWDHYWCPVSRKSLQSDPPDYLGVYANVTYRSYTSLLPWARTLTVTDRTVYRIEPRLS